MKAEDFAEQVVVEGRTVVASKQPGHTLLLHMLKDSRLLQMVGKMVPLSLWGQPQWLGQMRVRLAIRRLRVRPQPGLATFFIEVNHEIFSMVILSLPFIQEGHLSVSGYKSAQVLVNCL